MEERKAVEVMLVFFCLFSLLSYVMSFDTNIKSREEGVKKKRESPCYRSAHIYLSIEIDRYSFFFQLIGQSNGVFAVTIPTASPSRLYIQVPDLVRGASKASCFQGFSFVFLFRLLDF